MSSPSFFPLQGVSMITRPSPLPPPPRRTERWTRITGPWAPMHANFRSTSPLNLPLRRIVRSSGAHGGTNRERSEPKMNNYRSRGGGEKRKKRERKSWSMRRKLTRCSLIELVGEVSCDTFKRVSFGCNIVAIIPIKVCKRDRCLLYILWIKRVIFLIGKMAVEKLLKGVK